MNKPILPTPALLRKMLRYCPATGKLFWKRRTSDMFDKFGPHGKSALCKQWNGRFYGKEAFTSTATNEYKTGSILNKRGILAHRVIWAIVYGEWPKHQIDHINGVRSDNAIKNLRSVTRQENLKNKAKPKNNTSGHTGVNLSSRGNRWRAHITVGYVRHNLGTFTDKAAAIAVRADAEIKYGFHKNHGR